jgi:cobalt/nickel transport system permease protein
MFEKEDSEKMIPYIGVLAAVIFAFQFVNYPVPGGTSGHLVGGTLVAIILGPWASVIVLFLILVIQSLFGDGGITALGPNAFNMGIIGGIVGFYIVVLLVRLFNKTSLKKELKVTIATAIGSYIAIVLASFICGIEIGIGSKN